MKAKKSGQQQKKAEHIWNASFLLEKGEKWRKKSMRELLMIHALNERDIIRDRIFHQIKDLCVVDYKKQGEARTADKLMEVNEFCEKAKRDFQSIQDLIRNYDQIDAAIVASNAKTMIKTKYGEYTVAAAIALKQRLKISAGKEMSRAILAMDNRLMAKRDFESEAIQLMQNQLIDVMEKLKKAQSDLEMSAEMMRNNILGGDKTKKDAASLAVVEEYLKANRYTLVDPLNLSERIAKLKEEREELLNELDTAIKISNATTTIQVNF